MNQKSISQFLLALGAHQQNWSEKEEMLRQTVLLDIINKLIHIASQRTCHRMQTLLSEKDFLHTLDKLKMTAAIPS